MRPLPTFKPSRWPRRAPPRRGRGAVALASENSARAAGAHAIWLHVDAENSAAIRLYERHGYIAQGREEHYYARNRAALIYSKQLAQSDPGATNPANSAL